MEGQVEKGASRASVLHWAANSAESHEHIFRVILRVIKIPVIVRANGLIHTQVIKWPVFAAQLYWLVETCDKNDRVNGMIFRI
jgi:hypothetical protein